MAREWENMRGVGKENDWIGTAWKETNGVVETESKG